MNIKGTYHAKGNEEWLIVGTFSNIKNGDTLKLNNNGYDFAYYYIDSVSVIEDQKENVETLTIPEVFTPNNDSYNDDFEIKLSGYKKCNYSIYNRWGNQVYAGTIDNISNTNQIKLWDGTYKDKKLPTGTYFYLIEITNEKNEITIKKGFIQLIN